VVPNLPKYRGTHHKEAILNFKEGAQFLPGIMINLAANVLRFDKKKQSLANIMPSNLPLFNIRQLEFARFKYPPFF